MSFHQGLQLLFSTTSRCFSKCSKQRNFLFLNYQRLSKKMECLCQLTTPGLLPGRPLLFVPLHCWLKQLILNGNTTVCNGPSNNRAKQKTSFACPLEKSSHIVTNQLLFCEYHDAPSFRNTHEHSLYLRLFKSSQIPQIPLC